MTTVQPSFGDTSLIWVLWFNFILGSNFISLCLGVW